MLVNEEETVFLNKPGKTEKNPGKVVSDPIVDLFEQE